MNNVYLFELDSVRNSKKEIEIAQKSLYREILLNGNNVIITFNQLSDSQFLLTLLNSDEHYEMLMKMFRHGYLKVSMFRSVSEIDANEEIRTASSYMQDALTKALTKNEAYHFSGTPISKEDTYLLNEIRRALKNSDPELLTEDIENLEKAKDFSIDNINEAEDYINNKGSDFLKEAFENYKTKNGKTLDFIENDIKRLHLFYKYVRLILLVSQQKLAHTTSLRVKEGRDFISNINRAVDNFTSNKCKYDDKEFKDLYDVAIKDIDSNRKEKKNNRSRWYTTCIEESHQTNIDALALEEMIIDICYNFTCQFSISGIDSEELINDEDKFCDKYFKELYAYYLTYKNHSHSIHSVIEKVDEDLKPLQDIEWDVAYDIRRDVESYCESKPQKANKPWHKLVIKTQLWNTLASVFSMVFVFVLVNLCLDAITGVFESINFISEILDNGLAHIILYFLIAIPETIIFGLLSSKLSDALNVIDILDIVNILKSKFHHLRVYRKERKMTDGELYR